MAKINILVKEPGEDWKKMTVDDDLGVYQALVGGYIETWTTVGGDVIICNEDGWLNNLPINCEIDGNLFCGTILKCRQSGEEFASIW